MSKIQHLEGELLRLKISNAMSSSRFVDCADSHDNGYGSKHGDGVASFCGAKAVDIPGNPLEILVLPKYCGPGIFYF